MFTRYQQLVAEVRASYSPAKAAEERRTELLAFAFYRPVSFYLTPLFWRSGWTADGVTLLQFVLAAALPVVALAGGWTGAGLIVGLALLGQVLDCVDGNLARVTGYHSAAGSMLDGLCTLLFWSLYFFAVGVLAQDSAPGWIAAHGREIGLALAALMLAQREMEDTYAASFDERVRWTPPAVQHARQWPWIGKLLEQLVAFGGLLGAAALGRIDWLLGVIAVYQVAVLLLWLPRFGRAVRARMRQRISER